MVMLSRSSGGAKGKGMGNSLPHCGRQHIDRLERAIDFNSNSSNGTSSNGNNSSSNSNCNGSNNNNANTTHNLHGNSK